MKLFRSFAVVAVACAVAAGLTVAQGAVAQAKPTGPYDVSIVTDTTLKDHTIYRPKSIPDNAPVLVYGQGGCIENGLEDQALLRQVASTGVVVLATGGPLQLGISNVEAMDESIDWAKARTNDPSSQYFGRLNAENVAVAGWSCGGLESYALASRRSEVKAIGILNSGQLEVDQAQLDSLSAPVLYLLGGPSDPAYKNGLRDFANLPESLPAFLANADDGHIGTRFEKNGGAYADILSDWIAWHIESDAAASATFVGPNCGLCTDTKWEIQKRNIS